MTLQSEKSSSIILINHPIYRNIKYLNKEISDKNRSSGHSKGRLRSDGILCRGETSCEKLDYIGVLVVLMDPSAKVRRANKTCMEVSGFTLEGIKGRYFWEVFLAPEHARAPMKQLKNLSSISFPIKFIKHLITKVGSRLNVSWTIMPIHDENGDIRSLVATGVDMTESCRVEEALRFLSMHDAITGLYNRTYFEEEMRRLDHSRESSIGIMVVDMDGLNIVNNTLGHEAGDAMLKALAGIFKQAYREGDMVARIGGDEFAVILPGISEEVLQCCSRRLEELLEEHNKNSSSWPLSFSVGYAVRMDCNHSLRTTFEEADKKMYQEKLQKRSNARNNIMDTLHEMLKLKDHLDLERQKRMEYLVLEVAKAIGLTENSMNKLPLLTQYHDVGIVGLPDQILFKPGKLTPEEFDKLKEHCQVGYRIAWSAPDIAPIAELILKHHEWWNGQGYPLGLEREQIPLECRILAIVDAYNSMTSDRPYRKALSHEEAIQEIKRCAGTQFDPALVPEVIRIIQKHRQMLELYI